MTMMNSSALPLWLQLQLDRSIAKHLEKGLSHQWYAGIKTNIPVNTTRFKTKMKTKNTKEPHGTKTNTMRFETKTKTETLWYQDQYHEVQD